MPRPLAALLLSLFLLACDRQTEQAKTPAPADTQRQARERELERQANADGAKLEISLGEGKAMRMEGLDRHGKAVLLETGVSDIGATEIGLPLYPGASLAEAGGTRSRSEGLDAWELPLQSGDAPARVAAFYRAEIGKLPGLKGCARLPGEAAGGVQLVAIYGIEHRSLSVGIEPAAGGSNILILRSEPR